MENGSDIKAKKYIFFINTVFFNVEYIALDSFRFGLKKKKLQLLILLQKLPKITEFEHTYF